MDPTLQTTASAIDAQVPAEGEFVAFHLAGRRFAIAIESVERVVRAVAVTPLPHAPAVVIGIVNVAGDVVPVMDVRQRLGVEPRDLHPEDHLLFAVSRGRRIALAVDAVEEIVRIEPNQRVALDTPHLRGVVKLPEGLLLIHDVDAFLSADEEQQLDDALREVPE